MEMEVVVDVDVDVEVSLQVLHVLFDLLRRLLK